MGSKPPRAGRRYGLIRALALLPALAACTGLGAPPAPGAEGDIGLACISRLHVESQPAGPLPSRLISLLTPEGQARLLSCDQCASYPWLAASFDTQITQAFCGVASSVMVLNASGGPKHLSAPYEPYRYFTQCNIFNDRARARLDLDLIADEGLTLAQLQWLLNAQDGVRATCVHAGAPAASGASEAVPPCEVAGDARQFRGAAKAALGERDRFVLINYSRATLSDNGQGGGHFSPLGAYHEESDSFLVMDVARYKYPPFWVDADLLWQAMATTDAVSDRHRGYVIIDAPQAP
jgi:Phytochelatin synthase